MKAYIFNLYDCNMLLLFGAHAFDVRPTVLAFVIYRVPDIFANLILKVAASPTHVQCIQCILQRYEF